jgi:hypothetical protein
MDEKWEVTESLICYILTLPLLFPYPPLPLLLHLQTSLRPLILGTALLSSPSLKLSLPTPLISFLVLPPNLSLLLHSYVLGLILHITLPSSTPFVLTVPTQSFALHLALIRLTLIVLSTLPFVESLSALLTTLMVVITKLSS